MSGYAFPSSSRLKRRVQFKAVYANGVRVPRRYLVVFAVAKNGGVCRLGVTASRRVGGAVVRARCRRRLRELFRLHGRQALEGLSVDVVINARKGLGEAPWAELEREFLDSVAVVRARLTGRHARTTGGNRRGSGS